MSLVCLRLPYPKKRMRLVFPRFPSPEKTDEFSFPRSPIPSKIEGKSPQRSLQRPIGCYFRAKIQLQETLDPGSHINVIIG